MATLVLAMAYIFLAPTVFAQDLQITLPEKCVGKTFCEEPPENYPYEFLEKFVTENNVKFAIPKDPFVPSVQYSGDETNCKKSSTTIKPFSLIRDNVIKLVVQTQYFSQYIEQVECRSTGSACFEGLAVNASCHTTKGEMKIYLFNPKTQNVEHTNILLNMCCSCVITGRSFNTKDNENYD